MDWSNVAQALMNGAHPGSAIMAGFSKPQQQQPQYTQQPVPQMSQPMYSNALGQPAGQSMPQAPAPQPQAPDAGQAPGMANAPGMPGAQQQHGAFSNILKMMAGG